MNEIDINNNISRVRIPTNKFLLFFGCRVQFSPRFGRETVKTKNARGMLSRRYILSSVLRCGVNLIRAVVREIHQHT